MGRGHHYIPGEVTRDLGKYLSNEAKAVFEQGVTGNPEKQVHNFGVKYYGVRHADYNEIVYKLTEERVKRLRQLGQLANGKMSGAQARTWLNAIKTNGGGNANVLAFNRGVLEHLKLISLAGLLGGFLLNEAVAAIEVAGQSKHLKNGYAALLNNDLRTATIELIGENDSLYWDLIRSGHEKAALVFQDRFLKAVRRARDPNVESLK